MTKFNRSDIFKKAWKMYKGMYINQKFDRTGFAYCLHHTWAAAKEQARQQHLTELSGSSRQNMIDRLHEQATMLNYKSFRYNISSELAAINKDLRALGTH